MVDRLFVPLNKHWYDLFKSGDKKWEIRGISGQFNEKTVRVGRNVELRRGYAKEGAIWGKIVEVYRIKGICETPPDVRKELFPIPADSWLWNEIKEYEKKYRYFMIFKIAIDRRSGHDNKHLLAYR